MSEYFNLGCIMSLKHIWTQFMCKQYRTPSPMMVYGVNDKRLCVQLLL